MSDLYKIEQCEKEGNTRITRYKVQGGYIYLTAANDGTENFLTSAFVPDNPSEAFAHYLTESYNQGFDDGKKEAFKQSQKLPSCIHGLATYCSKCD